MNEEIEIIIKDLSQDFKINEELKNKIINLYDKLINRYDDYIEINQMIDYIKISIEIKNI